MSTHTDLSRDMGRVVASLEALENVVSQRFQTIKSERRVVKSDG